MIDQYKKHKITEHFPSKSEIETRFKALEVYFNDEYKYHIVTQLEFLNLKTWAILNNQTQNIHFIREDGVKVTINKNGSVTALPEEWSNYFNALLNVVNAGSKNKTEYKHYYYVQ